jgi:hypothetical protein
LKTGHSSTSGLMRAFGRQSPSPLGLVSAVQERRFFI